MEVTDRYQCQYVEIRWSDASFFSGRDALVAMAHKVGVRYFTALDSDAFVDSLKVRGCIEAARVSRLRQYAVQHVHDGTLAVRAGDMRGQYALFRIAEIPQQSTHVVQ